MLASLLVARAWTGLIQLPADHGVDPPGGEAGEQEEDDGREIEFGHPCIVREPRASPGLVSRPHVGADP